MPRFLVMVTEVLLRGRRMAAPGSSRSDRQSQREDATSLRAPVEPEPPALALRQAPADVEAEPGAWHRARSARAVVRLEEPVLLVGWYAHALGLRQGQPPRAGAP